MDRNNNDCQKDFIGKDCRCQECVEGSAEEAKYLSDQMEDR
jgi:hypothetical protein